MKNLINTNNHVSIHDSNQIIIISIKYQSLRSDIYHHLIDKIFKVDQKLSSMNWGEVVDGPLHWLELPNNIDK